MTEVQTTKPPQLVRLVTCDQRCKQTNYPNLRCKQPNYLILWSWLRVTRGANNPTTPTCEVGYVWPKVQTTQLPQLVRLVYVWPKVQTTQLPQLVRLVTCDQRCKTTPTTPTCEVGYVWPRCKQPKLPQLVRLVTCDQRCKQPNYPNLWGWLRVTEVQTTQLPQLVRLVTCDRGANNPTTPTCEVGHVWPEVQTTQLPKLVRLVTCDRGANNPTSPTCEVSYLWPRCKQPNHPNLWGWLRVTRGANKPITPTWGANNPTTSSCEVGYVWPEVQTTQLPQLVRLVTCDRGANNPTTPTCKVGYVWSRCKQPNHPNLWGWLRVTRGANNPTIPTCEVGYVWPEVQTTQPSQLVRLVTCDQRCKQPNQPNLWGWLRVTKGANNPTTPTCEVGYVWPEVQTTQPPQFVRLVTCDQRCKQPNYPNLWGCLRATRGANNPSTPTCEVGYVWPKVQTTQTTPTCEVGYVWPKVQTTQLPQLVRLVTCDQRCKTTQLPQLVRLVTCDRGANNTTTPTCEVGYVWPEVQSTQLPQLVRLVTCDQRCNQPNYPNLWGWLRVTKGANNPTTPTCEVGYVWPEVQTTHLPQLVRLVTCDQRCKTTQLPQLVRLVTCDQRCKTTQLPQLVRLVTCDRGANNPTTPTCEVGYVWPKVQITQPSQLVRLVKYDQRVQTTQLPQLVRLVTCDQRCKQPNHPNLWGWLRVTRGANNPTTPTCEVGYVWPEVQTIQPPQLVRLVTCDQRCKQPNHPNLWGWLRVTRGANNPTIPTCEVGYVWQEVQTTQLPQLVRLVTCDQRCKQPNYPNLWGWLRVTRGAKQPNPPTCEIGYVWQEVQTTQLPQLVRLVTCDKRCKQPNYPNLWDWLRVTRGANNPTTPTCEIGYVWPEVQNNPTTPTCEIGYVWPEVQTTQLPQLVRLVTCDQRCKQPNYPNLWGWLRVTGGANNPTTPTCEVGYVRPEVKNNPTTPTCEVGYVWPEVQTTQLPQLVRLVTCDQRCNVSLMWQARTEKWVWYQVTLNKMFIFFSYMLFSSKSHAYFH